MIYCIGLLPVTEPACSVSIAVTVSGDIMNIFATLTVLNIFSTATSVGNKSRFKVMVESRDKIISIRLSADPAQVHGKPGLGTGWLKKDPTVIMLTAHTAKGYGRETGKYQAEYQCYTKQSLHDGPSSLILSFNHFNELVYIFPFFCAKFIICRSITEGNHKSHRTV